MKKTSSKQLANLPSKKVIRFFITATLLASTVLSCSQKPKAPADKVDREAIRQTLHKNIPEVRKCYEEELELNESEAGKVVIDFLIVENGKVLESKVDSSSLQNPQVADCIAGKVKSIRFPSPPNNQAVRIKFPFVFNSKKNTIFEYKNERPDEYSGDSE